MTKQHIIALFITMIISSVVISAATVVGTTWYMKQANHHHSWLSELLAEQPQSQLSPSFQSLEKLVLSVRGKKQTHFVMLELAIETRRPDRMENINDYMPVVRNAMLNLFSQKTYEDLHGANALVQLQDEVKVTVLGAFEKTDLVHDIDDVLLTKYVVQ
ncbi:flagellar protein [Vibrio sp. 10N.286.49.C2]|uniref:flagellar basal body-associated FliL family protein n=1 Tax=unclassified Vibrio TaxID=2614977 RepID=UPI000C83B3CD|nr:MULTISPECIES: flagellar basal body-associated FliL family protein [unclassified Vibrio]PMH37357.1 flagellar protein [Vibrio sp. 10N.286.49.C2]PMH49445.1 flagellar protein [Vibrio sp. 10N.286.49.B1]PMH83870.1 flagellar protein [Vibrio sp. 10N.286.48.B7]